MSALIEHLKENSDNNIFVLVDESHRTQFGEMHNRMKKVFPYPITFEDDGVICVKEEGIRWLYENYFKRGYLKELEEYKWELEIRKNNVKVKT